MRSLTAAFLAATAAGAASRPAASAFVASRPLPRPSSAAAADAAADAASGDGSDPLGLTPELRRITDAFSSIPDEKLRYKQLLFMAQQLPPVPPSLASPENKVPGCLSTVYVDATLDGGGEGTVSFVGDSDGLLTKGLVALLVRGLSGCTPEQIGAVDPEFISAAGISQSLTPGRNNGFLNMIAVMKAKAAALAGGGEVEAGGGGGDEVEEAADGTEEDGAEAALSFEPIDGKPMYNEIVAKLLPILKPTALDLVDESDQHAGHGGAKGWEESGESHFRIDVTAEAFEGLRGVKRHQLIYVLLGDTMEKIHALSIKARAPSEVEEMA